MFHYTTAKYWAILRGRGFDPLDFNVFAYGRGTENRTLINRLKAYYFAVKLYPHMVHSLRIELS